MKIKNYISRFFLFIGFDIKKAYQNVIGLFFYFSDLRKLINQRKNDLAFRSILFFPILNERYGGSGVMRGHYFHQDLFVASKIFKRNPKKHVDIGSRTDGFVAHVASFREIEIFDIRENNTDIENIIFRRADLMELPEGFTNYCDSISSLHVIEHFGLGRYNDKIDYWGHEKAILNIHKILKKNGVFYFSVPIGYQRIEFNAHRVFSLEYLLPLLRQNFTIESFSYVNDLGDFYKNVNLESTKIKENFGCNYGCGIFELRKNS